MFRLEQVHAVVLTVARRRSSAGVENADDGEYGDACFGGTFAPGDGACLAGSPPAGCGPSAAALAVGVTCRANLLVRQIFRY